MTKIARWLPKTWLRSESSLSRDFALVSSMIVSVVAFLAIWLAWDASEQHKEKHYARLESFARQIDQQVHGAMDSTRYILMSLARQVELFGETDHIQIARLLTSFDTRPDVYSLFAWINKSQMIKISSNEGVIEIPSADVSDEAFQQTAMTSPWSVHIGRPIPSRFKNPDLPLVIGLTEDTGKYIGTLIISLDMDRMAETIGQAPGFRPFSFAVYSTENKQLLGEYSLSNRSISEFYAETGGSPRIETITDGATLLPPAGSIRGLAFRSETSPYYIVIAEEDTHAWQSILSDMMPRLMQIALPASFLIAVLWFIRHRLIRPVLGLSDAAASLARGQQQVEIPMSGPVEITHLALQIQRIKEYILERKMIEDELRRKTIALKHAKEESELADRTKSEFLACMSHELRTPLNAIIGFSDVILQRYYGDINNPKYEQYVTDIRNSGQHLLEIINDILDLAKVEAGAMTLHQSQTDIKTLLEKTVRLLSERAQHAELSVTIQAPENLPLVLVDPLRIKQILINLLSNAIKFTPKGGHIEVTAAYRAHHPFPIAITITDNGRGMAPEDIPIALSKFGQIDRGGDRSSLAGTGLGLPLSRELIQLHQGELTVQSELGKSTSVTITLPAARVV